MNRPRRTATLLRRPIVGVLTLIGVLILSVAPGGFARKISYIDKENYLPLKEEYYNDKGEMTRLFTAEKVEDIDGFTTMTVRKMEDLKKGSHTIVAFNDIKYNVGLKDDIFTQRYLKNPPRQFIQ